MVESLHIRPVNFPLDCPDLKAFLGEERVPAIDILEPATAEGSAFIQVAELAATVIGWSVVRTAFRADAGWDPESTTAHFVAGTHCYLEYIQVAAPYQQRGIGTALLHQCEKEARERGKHQMWLHTGDENTKAHSVYQRSGWRHQETVNPSWADGRSMRVYTKALE